VYPKEMQGGRWERGRSSDKEEPLQKSATSSSAWIRKKKEVKKGRLKGSDVVRSGGGQPRVATGKKQAFLPCRSTEAHCKDDLNFGFGSRKKIRQKGDSLKKHRVAGASNLSTKKDSKKVGGNRESEGRQLETRGRTNYSKRENK